MESPIVNCSAVSKISLAQTISKMKIVDSTIVYCSAVIKIALARTQSPAAHGQHDRAL